jgi:hypothetical protein
MYDIYQSYHVPTIPHLYYRNNQCLLFNISMYKCNIIDCEEEAELVPKRAHAATTGSPNV